MSTALRYLVTFLAGCATGYILTVWFASPADEPRRSLREMRSRMKSRITATGVIAVALALAFLGIALQQYQYQHGQRIAANERAAQVACVSRWGGDVVRTITARTAATQRLEDAKQRRDEAVDAIIGVVIRGRETPPQAGEKDFDRALHDFATAKANLLRVQQETNQTREANPYPPPPALSCPER